MKSEKLPKEVTAVEMFDGRSSNRKLFFHDSVAFLVLFFVTVVLYIATSLLFRSFSDRQEELAKEFSNRGQEALRQNDPEKAIRALRTALGYSADDPKEHLLLAEALAEGHHNDEAIDYFLTLREAEPASGLVNLELARLYRGKADSTRAISFYRAASLGNWDNNGIQQRLQVELELSQYLIDRGNPGDARLELLMAAQNVPESASTEVVLGDMLLQAGDSNGALASYEQAIQWDPHSVQALSKAGRILYDMGHYAHAKRILDLAIREHPNPDQEKQLSALSASADRFLRLSVSSDLPADERAKHLRADATIAEHRLDSCIATLHAATLPAPVQALQSQWRNLTIGSAANEDNVIQLIFSTETTVSQVCGQATGDDALLLLMSKATPNSQEKQ